MIHGRSEDRARALQEELGDATAYVLGDVGDPAVCELAVRETVDRFGAIHCISNNAALTWRATLAETDAETFDRMIAVNLRAPILVIRAAQPHFLQQGFGTVVNIGSVNALCGQPNLLPYSAAKGGLATATRNMANALADNRIRVNQLNVGWVTSPNEIALQQSEGHADRLGEASTRNLRTDGPSAGSGRGGGARGVLAVGPVGPGQRLRVRAGAVFGHRPFQRKPIAQHMIGPCCSRAPRLESRLVRISAFSVAAIYATLCRCGDGPAATDAVPVAILDDRDFGRRHA